MSRWMSLVTLCLFISNTLSQPEFGFPPFGGPMGDPMMGGGPMGPPPFGGPFGPFGRRPPWMRHHHHRHHRPPWAWGGPPVEEEFTPPVEEPQSTPPTPSPPPPPQPMVGPPAGPPAIPIYSTEVTSLINDVDSHSTAFSRPGESYSAVLDLMKDYYTRKTGRQYDMSSVVLPSASVGEMSANRRVAAALFESDLLLTVPQMRHITQGGRRVKRKMNSNSTQQWRTTNIPYRFAINDATWQSQIKTALNRYTQNTCIRFTENGRGSDYILFNRGEGCYSGVGKLGGIQEVSIGYGCETTGIIMHEVGHALGLWHEQARPERDSYVRVRIDNAARGTEVQFDKRTSADSNDFGVPYDYGSVMHYAANAFAKSSSVSTVEPLDSSFSHTIGNRVEPSFLDYKALNRVFCGGICRSSPPCQSGGYPDPNNCQKCLCPTGLGGNYCEKLQYSGCGTELPSPTSDWRNISYSGSSDCYWRIRAPSGDRIRLQMTHVFFKCDPTCEEFVEIKAESSFERTGFRLCCKAEYGERVSQGSDVIIVSKATQPSQFVIRYRLEPSAHHNTPAPPRTTVRRRPASSGIWTAWSGWSGCTERCGACGTRKRTRACSSGTCSGGNSQTQVCNMQPCQQGTTLSRGKRDITAATELLSRHRRAAEWCCAGYILRHKNVCERV